LSYRGIAPAGGTAPRVVQDTISAKEVNTFGRAVDMGEETCCPRAAGVSRQACGMGARWEERGRIQAPWRAVTGRRPLAVKPRSGRRMKAPAPPLPVSLLSPLDLGNRVLAEIVLPRSLTVPHLAECTRGRLACRSSSLLLSGLLDAVPCDGSSSLLPPPQP